MVAKRRTVWLSDEDWDRLGRIAEAGHMNVSTLLRGWADPLPNPVTVPGFGHSHPAPKPRGK